MKILNKKSAEYEFLDETNNEFTLYDRPAKRNIIMNKSCVIKAEVYYCR